MAEIGGQVWAGGNSIGDGLVARWTGKRWKHLPTPPRHPAEGMFFWAIDGSSPTDVWAAGYVTDGESWTLPIALHWDGQRWTTYDIPLPDGASGIVYGVTAIAPNDVWAVGTGSRERPPILVHWDGTSWEQASGLLGPTDARVTLRAVDALAPDDVWAVGTADHLPAAVHWDGQRWTWMAVDQGEGAGDWSLDMLYGVTAVAPDDVWAVGAYSGRDFEDARGRIVHWDGERWGTVQVVNVGEEPQLNGVSASGSEDVWAVGTYERPGEDIHRHLYLHFDGNRWSRVRPDGTERPLVSPASTGL